MLLPHGYEGQGPEHFKRTIRAIPTAFGRKTIFRFAIVRHRLSTFIVLRRQIRQQKSKPLVMMTPKSMLRHPHAVFVSR